MTQGDALKISGARENNLRELSFEIPHDELVVVTGLSGSGKSSLAFDTVYAEGQRRYIETFSPYVRQFLDKIKHPNIDAAEGVRPAIAIQQRTRVVSSRSTVGSMTNINDYLKLVWAAFAEPYCPSCNKPIKIWKSAELAQMATARAAAGETVLIGIGFDFTNRPFAGELERLVSLGYSRFLEPTSREVKPLSEASKTDLDKKQQLLLVIDRLRGGTAVSPSSQKRIAESIEQAFAASTRCAIIYPNETVEYSNAALCSNCGTKVAKPRPALFSYNHPLGACAECRGFGKILAIDAEKVIPNPMLTIAKGAIACWGGDGAKTERKKLLAFCEARKIPTDIPWRDIKPAQQKEIFEHKSTAYRGILPWFKAVEKKAYKMHVRVFLAKYRTQVDCSVCNGMRFNRDALAYRLAGKMISEAFELPAGQLFSWLSEYFAPLEKNLPRQVRDTIRATLARLNYLVDLGLEYLTLSRQSRTLSGGETQRVNLSTALGSELTSTHFVLDEPSVGLHPRDTERLLKSVQGLHKLGNSVLMVEHDPDVIAGGTQVLEMGPAAGKAGGEITWFGPTESWNGIPLAELIAPHLASLDPRAKALKKPFASALSITRATARNLKGFDVQIPLKKFVCISGVSGSGKSTLIHEVLMRAAQAHQIGLPQESKDNLVTGLEQIDEVLLVDQSPMAKSPRANIATYTGIWDRVRELLSETPAATALALSKSAFSFNVDGGRCPHCSGAGFIREDMQFLSDVYIPCEHCLGQRFQSHVLSVKFRDSNAHEILAMTVEEARTFFADESSIESPCRTLSLLGLGHLTLGHSLSELSGGEAQRLKLVPYLEKQSGSNLFIFDEPTTGLHPHDVARLISLFEAVRDRGHSILCVEHNLQLLLAADYLIDLGPHGGERGGELLAEGPVSEFLKRSTATHSETARYLEKFVAAVETEQTKKATKSRPKQNQSKQSATAPKYLEIEGARHHNLKNISVKVPLNKVVALTGVSGSGKSTIAKDIIYAEGQRRYLDCLSPYARQFVQELTRPDVDHIRNIKPAICVYQHTFQPGRLSTVGTMSEAYNFLRLLYSKVGVQHCPDHPEERIMPLSAEGIVEELKKIRSPQVRLLAPVIKQKKGTHREVLARAVAAEISQVRVDGVFLSPQAVAVGAGLQKSKAHSIDFVLGKFNPATVPTDLAAEVVKQGLSLSGGTLIALPTSGPEVVFSTDRTCPICKRGFFKPDPEDLSFHSTRGRCERCGGTGVDAKGKSCAVCGGSRLNEIGRNVRLSGRAIHELCAQTSTLLRDDLTSMEWSKHESAIVTPILRELVSRLDTVAGVGLEYLPLSRDCSTLSGGELQRLRLAAAMGSPLTGAIYIFDEPSAGLHPLDNEKVLARIDSVKERGNSVIIIEHDPETITACEEIIEVGPGGGREGGEIVFAGTVEELRSSGDTATAHAVKELYEPVRYEPSTEKVSVTSPGLHCLKPLNVTIPLKALTTVCGVSGAGKSTFLHGVFAKTVLEGIEKGNTYQLNGNQVQPSVPIERLLYIDQQPIGANSRSTPASYLGLFDEIRKIFATSLEAKARGFEPSYFSYNTGKGRCAECGGLGVIKLEMNFLPDAAVVCESCRGGRYREEADSILYQGLSISAALKLTFEEAKGKFANHRKLLGPLRKACDLGLGYLSLGQPSTTLSGGESQRIKLVEELWAERQGHTVYVLDEPTTGLHKADVAKLMRALRELVAHGHTVLLIEHDPEVLMLSDHLIEFGPIAGGGQVVFEGTAAQLASGTVNSPWGRTIHRYITSGSRSNWSAGIPSAGDSHHG